MNQVKLLKSKQITNIYLCILLNLTSSMYTKANVHNRWWQVCTLKQNLPYFCQVVYTLIQTWLLLFDNRFILDTSHQGLIRLCHLEEVVLEIFCVDEATVTTTQLRRCRRRCRCFHFTELITRSELDFTTSSLHEHLAIHDFQLIIYRLR